MKVGFDFDLDAIGEARSPSAWLGCLPTETGARLDAIRSLLGRLSDRCTAVSQPGVQAEAELLELVRVEQWRAILARLEPLTGRPVPFTPIEWPLLQGALGSLHSLRDLYKRIHARAARAGEATSTAGQAPRSVAALLPLARALDAQARVVALQQLHRCVPQQADWDELCVLARNLQRRSLHDEALPDEVPLVKSPTARALFVYPLLLECASLAARTAAEIDLARRLAARVAARVGYRIDRGAPRENEHGPRLALTAGHAVRLDTHRVPQALEKWRRLWLGEGDPAGSASALPLPQAEAARLFADLERCWSPATTPRLAGAHPAASAASQPVQLRFGLPTTRSSERDAAADARGQPGAQPRDSDRRYDYGRWEQNTIIRLAFGAAPPVAAALSATWIGDSERATRLLDRPDGRTVIARESAVPRAAPGALVAIETFREKTVDAGGNEAGQDGDRSIALGTVEAIEQLPGRQSHAARAHWLVVRMWAGEARAVGVKVGDSAGFEDAWLLRGSGAAFELPCLVMAPGRAQGGDTGVLREPGGEVAIRFVSVLDRGIGHERLSMRTESARPVDSSR